MHILTMYVFMYIYLYMVIIRLATTENKYRVTCVQPAHDHIRLKHVADLN